MTTKPRPLTLQEWKTTKVDLSAAELRDLQSCDAGLLIQPVGATEYAIQATSIVGAISTPTLHLVIRPKFDIDQLFHLLGRTHRINYLREAANIAEHPALSEGFIALFANMVRTRLRRGLLKSYVSIDESLHVIRGRLRTADQLRRRFGLPLPAEVRYDDYTEDTPENRLIKAAARRLARLRPGSRILRARLAEILGSMALVRDVRYSSNALPRFRYTRLNEHYRPILELSALILRNVAVEIRPGAREIRALLFDMNQIFEDFIFESLRRRLPLSALAGDRWVQGEGLRLDREGVLRPEPDLSWWRGKRCLCVGDAKYKVTKEGRLADIYQLLAYCTASSLNEGLLIYAEQPAGPAQHRIVSGGQLLRVQAVNIEAPIPDIERRCDELAALIAQSVSRAALPSAVSVAANQP
jgi:5-methylcytosine-specific restriction enzyme subunit McrC